MKQSVLLVRTVSVVLASLLFGATPGLAVDPRFALSPELIRKSAVSVTRTGPPATSSKKTGRKKVRHATVTLHAASERADSTSSVAGRSVTAADLANLNLFWQKLVPPSATPHKALLVRSDNFELAIDPVRYPTMGTTDGKTILLDTDGSLPPLVRTLIQDQDPSVRVVTGSADRQHLVGALLAAGGFYSVDEQPVLRFGTDPLLTVRTDFKVERSADSVLRNEVTLVSAARQGMPPRVVDYLGHHGFDLLEPFADRVATPVVARHRVVQVQGDQQGHVVDLLLDLLGVQAERNRRIELFNPADTGISLQVAAERVFERNGKRYAVARFNGDPIAYTLYRLLATRGYRVVILEPQDTFRLVAAKLLDRMELPSSYRPHLLAAEPGGRYSLEMSGFLLENSAPDGGALMVTDRPVDRSMRDLLFDHGYQVQER
jgi:translation initiation factor 1 (eIF-1/SUI1)